jgi:hypothetical protein
MTISRAYFLLLLVIFAPLGRAQSVFNGTWRPDPETYGPTRKADSFELIDGTYSCQSCNPAYKIKADGQDQAMSGNQFYDTLSVAVIDGRTVSKVAKRAKQTVAESHIEVSIDGKTETERQTLYFMAPRPIELTSHATRVAAGAPGSHAISGSWRTTQTVVSNHAEDTIFTVTGGTLSMSDRMGRSFTAKLDGSEAPYNGSDEFTSVTLKLIDARTIEETDKKDGKTVKISRWAVDPDGKTIHVRFDNTQGFVQEQTGHKVE